MSIRFLLIPAALTVIAAQPNHLAAQSADSTGAIAPKGAWELVVPTGSLVPTGAQRSAFRRGPLTAVQLSYVARPALAFTATLGWGRTRDLVALGDPKLDVFTYDVGAEVRGSRREVRKSLTFMPFAGMGAGARSYSYRTLDADATHRAAAYASVGGELGVRRIRLRVDVRDYVTGNDGTRNDLLVMAGLRLVRR